MSTSSFDSLDASLPAERRKRYDELGFMPFKLRPAVDIHLLRSNVLPSDADLVQTHLVIAKEELELERYNAEIQRLVYHRDTLRQRIEHRRSWISPIRKLPPELLQEILFYVCDDYYTFSLEIATYPKAKDEKSGLVKTAEAPACQLSHVCSYWRTTATSYPRLWSTFDINVFMLDEGHQRLVELYIKNSTQHPLKIRLSESHWDPSGFENLEGAINGLGRIGISVFQSLIRQLPRCTLFFLDYKRDELISFLGPGDMEHATFSSLSRLCDGTPPRNHSSGARWFWECVKRASGLQHLSINFGAEKMDLLPFAQLQTLRIWHLEDYNSFLRLLPSLEVLEELRLGQFETSSLPSPVVPPIGLLSLRHLRARASQLHGLQIPYLDILFSSIIVPRLSSIALGYETIKTPDDDEVATQHWDSLNLANMIQRSASPFLTHFDLFYDICHIPESIIIGILQAAPNLTDIRMRFRAAHSDDSSVIPAICSRLAICANTTPHSMLVPRLRTLFVNEGWSLTDVQVAEGVVNMVESRSTENKDLGVVALTNVHVRFGGRGNIPNYLFSPSQRLPDHLLVRLHALKAGGTDCEIDVH